ncbi:hypothetical protein IFR04_010708 [Cadophora malorum]|uniref:Uncharacterized protein n=1 Tax=Cadophora malorum TaxID=108018 RepID=A0A8H7W9I5_9HELO|nr:hypothetical protein IFR04_010708 [Cadophora malorum]
MPPSRTPQQMSQPMKPVKTERTHEENQERAYIAASRRSDRSLEARVESARRASEIHKRRTGRSLRVTEKDVMDEEMYEEEDDGLPRQYRQLAAHLQTGNPDFNSRLEAYLTANVAMRSALERSISNSYAQQGQQYPTQYAGIYPSPMLGHQQYQQPMMQQSMQPPQQQQNQYRQAPYPSPRLGNDQRSASFAAPSVKQESSPVISQGQPPSLLDRRMSMPVTPASISPSTSSTPLSPLSQTTQKQKPSFPQGSFTQSYQMQQPQQSQSGINNFQDNNSGNFGPFSTALPNNAAGLLGSTFPFNDASMMMQGGNDSLPTYNFNNQPLPPTTSIGKQQMYPSIDGLNTTLAPSATELNYQPPDFFNDAICMTGNQEATPGQTPGLDNDWSSYVNFDDFPSSQASQT